ncbi:MAG: sulfotransferase [Candidatus Competibacteraceae bacterium]|jgi:hypothetical protein
MTRLPPPLLVLTCMRSYSSLVNAMLGQHPAMYGLPELNLFIADTLAGVVSTLQLVRPQSLHGLLRAVAQVEYQAQTVKTVEQARAWLRAQGHWNARLFFEHLASRLGSPILIDKSPSTVLQQVHLQRLHRTFPEARFLHLVRHPRPTSRSIHDIRRKAPRKSARVKAEPPPEQLWLQTNENILRFTERLPVGQSMLIQGEHLLSNPELYLAQIADWLEISSDAASLAAMLHPEASPYSCIGPPNAPFGNDPHFLRNPCYTKRPIPPQRLEGPLEWAAEITSGFPPANVRLAQRLGYR